MTYFNGAPSIFASLAKSVSVVVPCGRAVFPDVQQVSPLGASQGVPVGTGGISRGQRGAIVLMIEGTHCVNVLNAFFPSNDAALLAGLIPADNGVLSTPQELIIVQVRVPGANG